MDGKFKNVLRLLMTTLETAKTCYGEMIAERKMYEESEADNGLLEVPDKNVYIIAPTDEDIDKMKDYINELMEAIAMLGNDKYIAKVEDNTIDIHNLYDIIQKDTGLTQHEIFEAIYNEDGNGSRTWVDKVNCEEIIEKGWANKSMKKVYQWLYDRMNAGELPKEFYIHVWW